jgi:hypothetical protein
MTQILPGALLVVVLAPTKYAVSHTTNRARAVPAHMRDSLGTVDRGGPGSLDH